MTKLPVCAFIVALAIISYHVHLGIGPPPIDPSLACPWLPPTVSAALSRVMMPGAYLMWYLGLGPNAPQWLIAAGLLSWWAWVTGVRVAWHLLGRSLGIVNMADFHGWIRIAPPWRIMYRPYLRAKVWWLHFRYGTKATAAFTRPLVAMATLIFSPGDSVYLGRLVAWGFMLWQTLGIRGPKHVTVVGSSGSGKTRWAIGWLLMLPKTAAAFIIDCDAQISSAAAWVLERMGHKVCPLDPFGLGRFSTACWNALDEITAAVRRHGIEAAVRFALTLAEALIREDNSSQPVFANAARGFLHGLILFVWLFEPPERRNLVRVRELLARGMPELVVDPAKQDPFDLLLWRMSQAHSLGDDGCEGRIADVIARAAGLMRSGKNREGSNPFRSTALSQTAWLDLPEIAAISTRSDFIGEDLKTGNTVVFVIAPVVDIQTKLSGWARVLSAMTMYAFQNMPWHLKVPALFLMDEAPSLRLEFLDTAAPVFRKYGIRLVIITQDLEKLQQAYPQSWGGFIGNSLATLWFSTDHLETIQYLVKVLGTRTHLERIEGGHWFWRLTGFSKTQARYQSVERPLLYEHQVAELLDPSRGRFIVTRTGKPPVIVGYDGYDTALPVWGFAADTNYREKPLRALMRNALRWLFPAKMPPVSQAPCVEAMRPKEKV